MACVNITHVMVLHEHDALGRKTDGNAPHVSSKRFYLHSNVVPDAGSGCFQHETLKALWKEDSFF